MVEITGCLSREPGFTPQHSHSRSQLSVNSSLRGSDTLFQHVVHRHTFRQNKSCPHRNTKTKQASKISRYSKRKGNIKCLLIFLLTPKIQILWFWVETQTQSLVHTKQVLYCRFTTPALALLLYSDAVPTVCHERLNYKNNI